jgi:hypothetical protein
MLGLVTLAVTPAARITFLIPTAQKSLSDRSSVIKSMSEINCKSSGARLISSAIRHLSTARITGWIMTPASRAHRSSATQYGRPKYALDAGRSSGVSGFWHGPVMTAMTHAAFSTPWRIAAVDLSDIFTSNQTELPTSRRSARACVSARARREICNPTTMVNRVRRFVPLTWTHSSHAPHAQSRTPPPPLLCNERVRDGCARRRRHRTCFSKRAVQFGCKRGS